MLESGDGLQAVVEPGHSVVEVLQQLRLALEFRQCRNGRSRQERRRGGREAISGSRESLVINDLPNRMTTFRVN